MNMREAFGAFQEKWRRDTAGKFPSSFDYFCAIYAEGAAFAARECAELAEGVEIPYDAWKSICRAFPEAFRD